MTIHIVKSGETIQMIANQYGVSAERLMVNNGINDPNILVEGEAIVILIPETTYIVQDGDTLEQIALTYQTTVMQLLRNNPFLSDRKFIYAGEVIVISYTDSKYHRVETNSYVYPYINKNILKKTLPFLTYLTVMGYHVNDEGEINEIDDVDIIQTAREYGTSPIMMLEAFSIDIEEEIRVIHSLLISEKKQEQLVNNLIRIMQEKGYNGVNITTPYLYPLDRELYVKFVVYLYERISKAGFWLFNTFVIRVFQLLSGTIFTDLDFTVISRHSDGIILITYEYGYLEGIASNTASQDTYERFFKATEAVIPPQLIYAGVSVIGYIWEYPYIPGESTGNAISYQSAIDIAYNNNSVIKFDETTNTAYFQYISGKEYIVRFWDARSIEHFILLLQKRGINGISIWNSMTWFPQAWLVVNAYYDIQKVIE